MRVSLLLSWEFGEHRVRIVRDLTEAPVAPQVGEVVEVPGDFAVLVDEVRHEYNEDGRFERVVARSCRRFTERDREDGVAYLAAVDVESLAYEIDEYLASGWRPVTVAWPALEAHLRELDHF